MWDEEKESIAWPAGTKYAKDGGHTKLIFPQVLTNALSKVALTSGCAVLDKSLLFIKGFKHGPTSASFWCIFCHKAFAINDCTH